MWNASRDHVLSVIIYSLHFAQKYSQGQILCLDLSRKNKKGIYLCSGHLLHELIIH